MLYKNFFMSIDKKKKTALHIKKSIGQPSSLNEKLLKKFKQRKTENFTISDYVDGIFSGNRMILSKAITLIESSKPEHQKIAQKIIEKCLPHSGQSFRLGITGIPGSGKSTFIETLGLHLIKKGGKIAVLAIDPSSQRSKGSILGDKTRMENLAINPGAFIRPSASAGSLGGVARKTKESIILCEAAGFNTIFVETVGVGQSETTVASMVDFFLLLMIPGAGDELQGIKRGIIEMADLLLINKADGDNNKRADLAKTQFENTLHFFPIKESKWIPMVKTCSALHNIGIVEIEKVLEMYLNLVKSNGFFEKNRQQQSVQTMYNTINENLLNSFQQNKEVNTLTVKLKNDVINNNVSPYMAAQILFDNYTRNLKK